MKNYYYIFVIFILFSCKKEEKNPLIGNWAVKEKLNDEYNDYENFGLNILNDSILEYKFGFYEDVPTIMKTLNFDRRKTDMKITALRFLGTKTKYKVKNSTLQFWDLADSIWIKYQIKTLNNNNLILEDKNQNKYDLVKDTIIYNDSTLYDAIIVDRDHIGLGLTGRNTTYINRNGTMYFKGLGFNTSEDDFITQLNSNIIKPIFEKFNEIDILKMKDNYRCTAPDSQNNSITFVKNGKIIKTIQDCTRRAPIDFYAAYNELSYLYQKVKNKIDYNFILDNRLHFPSFENSIVQHKIYNSEFFLLELELQKGKETTIPFETKYTLYFSYRNGNQGFLFSKIETDGRYYKFYYNDTTTKTIDIGYNFIEANPIISSERK
ncbi:hypothetical protein FIA58_014805 [Flavobacterium jejuense]|uniref:DUF6438 domain-containing protein n=1 Tax=Flavobacterium jejuense TaxID=1544455 RepID=A0ABX0IY55_9FLAO|nr:DUF6438 domain-containing protein [Flavobacterium jejuense]NHN26951.1 hypothetical protein [Flavobacterium jejuense]